MSSFMASILTAGLLVLFVILIAIFVYIFKRHPRYPIKPYLKSIGLFSLLIFSMSMILYAIDYFFGSIGFFILAIVFLFVIFKNLFEDIKKLERKYKNGEISKEKFDKRKKEMTEFVHTFLQSP